jgi:hypothetical protein
MEGAGFDSSRGLQLLEKMMEWKIDKTLGYIYAIDEQSPYSNSQGKVYQHHYVMCQAIGRSLMPNECVHHIDRDRSNNQIENLLLLTHSEHGKLHALEDRGYSTETRLCLMCQGVFVVSCSSGQSFCSLGCARTAKRKFEISPEDLEALVWMMPSSSVAEMLGVSDVAIAKRCKKQSIKKPPRGYWAKLRSGQIEL